MGTTERTSFQTNFRNALNGIVLSFRNPTTKYKVWSDLRKQCTNGAKRSREVAKVILEKRQKDIDASCSTPDDMLSYVFKLKEVLPGCNIEDLIDMVVTLIFGGMVFAICGQFSLRCSFNCFVLYPVLGSCLLDFLKA